MTELNVASKSGSAEHVRMSDDFSQPNALQTYSVLCSTIRDPCNCLEITSFFKMDPRSFVYSGFMTWPSNLKKDEAGSLLTFDVAETIRNVFLEGK